MRIGDALKNLRLQSKLTQQEMASTVMSESFYSKVERNLHRIDAETLIELLSVHNFDIVKFMNQLVLKKRTEGKLGKLDSELLHAQYHEELLALNRMRKEIDESGEKSEYLQMRIREAYAWVLNSDEYFKPREVSKIKSVMKHSDSWSIMTLEYLNQVMVVIGPEDAYTCLTEVIRSYEKEPEIDLYTLIDLAKTCIFFIRFAWYKGGSKSDVLRVIHFLCDELPDLPEIGMFKLLAQLYLSALDKDEEKQKILGDAMEYSGYDYLMNHKVTLMGKSNSENKNL